MVVSTAVLALGLLMPSAVDARGFGGGFRSGGGGFRSGGFRSSGGFGGGFSSRPASRPAPRPSSGGFGGGFNRPTTSYSSPSTRRGTNFSTPPPSSRPFSSRTTPTYNARVDRSSPGRTTVYDGGRTVVYNHYWGGVPVPYGSPYGYSPWHYYGFYYMPWMFHNPYPPYMAGTHVGFFGAFFSFVVFIIFAIIFFAVLAKIISFLASRGPGGSRRARYS